MPKTSIKPMLNVRKDSSSELHTLVFQILRLRKRSLLFSPYRLKKEDFDANKERAVSKRRTGKHAEFIENINRYIEQQCATLHAIVNELERKRKPFDATQIVAAFRQRNDYRYVNTYFNHRIEALRREGKYGTAHSLEMTLAAFLRFSEGKPYLFDDIDRLTVEEFRLFLIREGLKNNTVTFYICKLRAVYNRCVAEGYANKRDDPFDAISIKVEKTRKLAVSDDVLLRVAKAALKGEAAVARDLFLMSFFCRGMSFVDMAYLHKSDIRDGTILYRRRKTGQLFAVKIVPDAQAIIDRYNVPESPFALPILMHRHGNERSPVTECPATDPDEKRRYEQELYNLYQKNRVYFLGLLRTISRKMELEINLSFNMARHTWASRARRKGIAMAIISEGLGHTTEKTTRIYLEEMDAKLIDEANKIITEF